MGRGITRREFIRSAVGAAFIASLGMSVASSKSIGRRKMPDKVRVATMQSNHVPTCDGLKTNPFSDDFSMNDLLQSIERRIAWYEELFDQAGREK